MVTIFTTIALLSAFGAIFLTSEDWQKVNLWACSLACGGGALLLWIVNGV